MAVAVKAQTFPRRRNGFYYLNGRRYVSVTTVLEVLAKPALIHWAARTAASLVLADPDTYDTAQRAAGGIYAARDKAADRGTLIHSFAEALARGATLDTDGLPDAVRGYGKAFVSWTQTVRPVPLFTEANVYSDQHGYAGTTDLIAAFPDKQIRLVDFKTGSAIYPEVGLQMEAYRACEFIVPHVNGDATRTIPVPPVAETAVVLLREDGTFEYRTMRGDLRVFLALKHVYEWLHQKEAN